MGRMMLYAWCDNGQLLNETKLGDHFVPHDVTLEEAKEHTLAYMRGQFPRRGSYFDTDSVVKHIWDVSEYAKKEDRFKGHSHIDDLIRKKVSGKRGTQGREFHTIPFNKLVDEVQNILVDAIPLYDLEEPKLRFSQIKIDAAIQKAYETNNRVALIAFGGFGKSYLSLRNASFLWQKEGNGYVLCLTNVVDNIDDFKEASEKFQFLGKRIEFVRLNELTATKFHKKIAECKANGWILFIVATVQDIRGNDSAEDDESEEAAEEAQKKLDTKYKFLSEEQLTALLQDEVHVQYAAEQTAKALQKLNPIYTLDMTATMGRREMAEFGYSQDQIVSYSMLEALEAKRNGTDPDMLNMPDLEFRVHRNIIATPAQLAEMDASVEDGWCSAKAFAMKNGQFIYPRWMLQIVQMTFALDVQMKAWKHAITTGQNTGVHMMIMPRGGNGEGNASDKCRLCAEMVNDRFGDEVYAISAYELRERAKAAFRTLSDQLDFEIEHNGKNKKVLIITHRVLLTGVNMPQLETIALFDRIGSSKLFMQTAYRLFRKYQYSDGSWKTKTMFVVFEPNVAIADTSAEAAIGGLLADHKSEGNVRVRELHNLISLNIYDGMEHNPVTAEELLVAQEAAAAAEWKEKFSNITDSTVESSIDLVLKTELLSLSIIGKGTSNGGEDTEKTQVTEDNGSETFKPGKKNEKTNFEKKQVDDWSKRLEIIIAMLGQAKVYAVHRSWTGTLGENLDIVQIMSSKQVTLTWGEANQKLVLEALKSPQLKEFMTNHLKAVVGELLNSTLAEAIMKVGGSVGPTKPEEGQAYWILDNQKVVELLFNRATRRLNPKKVKVVHPKSGMVALATRKFYPNAHIICETMDNTFDDILIQLGLEITPHKYQDTIITMKLTHPFDLIVGNPPYLDGLHIKIISGCLAQLSNDGLCIMIHPSTPYLRPGKEDLQYHLKSLEFIAAKDVWENVKLWVPLAIASLTKNKNMSFHMINDNIWAQPGVELTPFGLNPTVLSIRKKLRSSRTLDNIVERGVARGPYIVQLPRISGNAQKHDMFFLFPQTRSLDTNIKDEAGPRFNISFNNRDEALNLINFLISKLAMMGLSVNKLNQNIYLMDLTAIPWLDFTKNWTDAMLYEHFKLTPEEIDFVEALPAHPQHKAII